MNHARNYIRSIRFKLMLMVTIPLASVSLIYISVAMISQNKTISESNASALRESVQATELIINKSQTDNMLEARLVADSPTRELIAAVKARGTEYIQDFTRGMFANTECDAMIFTDMNGTVIAKHANFSNVGDNISSIINAASVYYGEEISYIHSTPDSGFAFVAGVPMLDKEKNQIGAMFLFRRLDQGEFISTLKAFAGNDVVIYDGLEPVIASFNMDTITRTAGISSDVWAEFANNKNIEREADLNGKKVTQLYIPLYSNGNTPVGSVMIIKPKSGNSAVYFLWFLVFMISTIIFTPIVSSNITRIVMPIRSLSNKARQLATGDLSTDVIKDRDDEIGVLQESMIALVECMRAQSQVIQEIASGNLTPEHKPLSEVDAVGNSIVKMLKNNNSTFRNVQISASQVSAAARQVAQGAQNLASGSSEQALTIDRFGVLLSDVQSVSNHNSSLAGSVRDEIIKTGNLMKESLSSMNELAVSMQTIHDSSQSITKVIKVIDDIAFQTNILALNAAVEAARAGQHGKGFAVVADEVRNLANKSAAAAKETAALIESSTESVRGGQLLTQATHETLNSATEIARANEESIAHIADLSESQKKAIDEITFGVTELFNVVQANAATAQESAAAAQEMSSQSVVLQEVVARFRLREKKPASENYDAENALLNPFDGFSIN